MAPSGSPSADLPQGDADTRPLPAASSAPPACANGHASMPITYMRQPPGNCGGASRGGALPGQAVASLSSGFVPPVINHEQADPLLGSLRLSEGGTHDAKYALHFAAGFGSQVSYVLYARC